MRGEAEAGRRESESKRATERRDKRLEYSVHAYRLLTLYFVSDPTGFVLPIRFRCPVSSFKDAVELLEAQKVVLCQCSVRLNLFSD